MAVGNNPQNIKNKLEEAGNTAGKVASDLGQQAKDAASRVGHHVSEAAGMAGQQAKDAASRLGHQASDVAGMAKDRANDAIANVGQGMQSLAGTVRHTLPRQGAIGTAAETVAGSLQSGGRYLQEHDLDDMTGEVIGLVKRYPVQSVLIGLGTGWLLGMVFSRR
jgi:ElaB/YqjD/DUF883 family membrane-anchored ribosome-binding protein